MAVVEVRDLRKHFDGGQVHAIDGVDLTAEDREYLVLLGPSGCGKTTTLRAIAGLEDIDSGDILIDGKAVQRLRAAERDIADPQASEAWLYGHAKCKRRRGLPLLPLWCNDAAAGGLAVLPIGRRIIRVTQSASAMPAAFILPRVAVRTPPVAAT